MVLCLVPALMTVFLVTVFMHNGMTDYVAVGGDTGTYWHEIATFAKAGLWGGHFGFEEMTAKAASLGVGTFGSHSVWFAMVYGGLGKIFGWYSYSGIYFNLGFMALGLILMAWLMRASWVFSLKACLFLATYLYLYLYSSLMMQESFHYAMAFVLAGLFHRVLSRVPVKKFCWPTCLLFVAIFLSALMRYSWGILFLAYFVCVDNPATFKQYGASAVKAIVSAVTAAMLYVFFAAPYPYEPFPGSLFGAQLYTKVLGGEWHLLPAHVLLNARALFLPGNITEFHVLFYADIVFVLASAPIILLNKASSNITSLDKKRKCLEVFLHLSNVGLMIIINVVYYYTMLGNVGLRTTTPHFLLSFLLLLRTVPTRWWYPFVAMFIVLVPALLSDFQAFTLEEYETCYVDYHKEEIGLLRTNIQYDNAAPDPWCNTALFVNDDTSILWLGIPQGVAINSLRFYPGKNEPYLFGRKEQTPFRAKYIIIRGDEAILMANRYNVLTALASSGNWVLYRNHTATCP
jgi:hypothetical protein